MLRKKNTGQQARLGAEERRANVIGAFDVTNRANVAGRRLVLIDDVTTTGSTLGACAKALADAGANWVGAVVLARET
jgi:predicted amidophosphoribosyltransferase